MSNICSKCGGEIITSSAKANKWGTEIEIVMVPCETCMKNEYKRGLEDGLREGEEAVKDANRELREGKWESRE